VGGPSLQDWLDGLGFADFAIMLAWVVGIGAFVVKVWPVLKAIRKVSDRTRDMTDDWFGEADRPGVPGRPGVMVRLEQHDAQLAEIRKSSASSAFNSAPNHGTSAWDHQTQEIRAGFARVEAKLAKLEPDDT
jgi:hypothetical protein